MKEAALLLVTGRLLREAARTTRLLMRLRDPRDRRYPERLAASYLASLLIHALLAALLFTMLVSSSEQGSNENVSGAEIVTLSQTSPVAVANRPSASHAVEPVPNVPVIAPPRHAPQAVRQAQRQQVNRHELAKIAPTAPPNPLPIPQRTPQPNPAPTQNIVETKPAAEIPAAPVTVPTIGPIAVSVKTPPTAAPSPAPSAAPVASASPRPPQPSARPSLRPATPAPALPKASPAPAAVARTTPAPVAGIPKPAPTSSATALNVGNAPKPAPSGGASPGPKPGSGGQSHAAPQRPIQVVVPPTAPPAPKRSPAPKRAPPNINARLRALLPNNPVNPTMKQYTPSYSLRGRLEPTPPPEILARTKYMYETRGTGNEQRIRMWVTETRKAGPTTICTGWLVRYPQPVRGNYAPLPSNVNAGGANGTQVTIGGGSGAAPPLSPFAAGIAPIVDGMVSQPCDGHLLVPFAGSSATSP
jgi:hypothetical protein